MKQWISVAQKNDIVHKPPFKLLISQLTVPVFDRTRIISSSKKDIQTPLEPTTPYPPPEPIDMSLFVGAKILFEKFTKDELGALKSYASPPQGEESVVS